MAKEHNRQDSNRGWRSWKLKLWCTTTILVCQTLALATIIALSVVSERYDGFATVSDEPLASVAGHAVSRHLLWTSFPAFLLALLNLAYAMVVSSSAERQPYEELVDKPKRSNAKLTILLDYQSYPPLYNWIVALKNKHYHLAGPMFVMFICSFSLVPLTASLFRPSETDVDKQIDLVALNRVNFQNLGIQTSLQPAIDLAGAVHAYGAEPPTWMTRKYAFDPFDTRDPPRAGDITATTSAYHVEPHCRVIQLANSGDASSSPGLTSTSFEFVDRGCRVSTSEWPIAPARQSYTYTWFQLCSSSVVPLDRIGVFGGEYSANGPNNLANATVISCLPEYFNTTVNLTMTFDAFGARRPAKVLPISTPSQMRLLNLRSINSNLPFYRQSQMSGDFKGDTFGNAVHSYAAALSPSSEFEAGIYETATEEVYMTMFAALSSIQLLEARPSIVDLRGQESTIRTHLYVSTAIACVICVLLVLMITCTIVLVVHVEQSSVILREEPVGLLSRALLLLRSPVMGFAHELEQNHLPDQRIDQVKQNYTLASSQCWLQGDAGSGAEEIRLEHLHEVQSGYELLPWWRRRFRKTPAQKRERQDLAEQEDVLVKVPPRQAAPVTVGRQANGLAETTAQQTGRDAMAPVNQDGRNPGPREGDGPKMMAVANAEDAKSTPVAVDRVQAEQDDEA